MKNEISNRRNFIKIVGVSGFAATALIAGCKSNKDINTQNNSNIKNDTQKAKIKIKLAMTWPITMPILAETVQHYKKVVETISNNSINIEIFPAGKLVPALGVFDAVSAGQIDAYHSAPYYWEGKNSVFNMFSGIPFGMIDSEMSAWYMFGDGMDLWREMAAKYNLHPMLGGSTNIQMAGWYKKEINKLSDFNGLQIRIVGVAAAILRKLGAATKNTPGAEIVPALERGNLDAAEWVSPAFDKDLGIYKIAKYYYTPWQEAGSITEFVFNKTKFDSYPKEVRDILEFASIESHNYMSAMQQYRNSQSLEFLIKEGVVIKTFSNEILNSFKKALKKVLDEESAKNKDFEKVLKSYQNSQKEQAKWSNVSLKAYLNIR